MANKAAIVTALVLALAAPAAFADETMCPLEPTPKRWDLQAKGVALLSDQPAESLDLKFSANLEDGTVLIDSATKRSGEKLDLGSFEMLLQTGSFTLSSTRDRFSKAFPTDEIAMLTIRLRETPIAEGKCGGGDGDVRR